MRLVRLGMLATLVATALGITPLQAQSQAQPQRVDVALVLAADVSRSITNDEFQLQRQGYAKAIANPDVVRAIEAGANGAIALTFVEWAGSDEQQVVVDWQIVRDPASAKAFTDTLLAAPRAFFGRTSISAALDFAMARLKASGVKAERQVIDVSGDGTNNAGRSLDDARKEALAGGVTINGLAIINDHPVSWTFAHVQPPGGLENYYRNNVIGGPASFVLTVHDFHSFGEAMTRKLVTEIAALSSPDRL